jgi:3-deoxy-7-phosphoheptulonate synthase
MQHTFSEYVLPSPQKLITEVPINQAQKAFVAASRIAIQKVLSHDDERFILIVGPCAIHDLSAGLTYATRLAELAQKVSNKLILVMRAYFEKPRTESNAWQGFLLDPELNGSFEVLSGLQKARAFYRALIDLKVPIACEILDLFLEPYFRDLICWGAIGARTVEAQMYRKYTSGAQFPVGFKNSTEGSIQKAIQAIQFAQTSQPCLSLNALGNLAFYRTQGNPHTHIILRGGTAGTNYDRISIRNTQTKLRSHHLVPNIMVDCTHGNSQKQSLNQADVLEVVIKQRIQGNKHIVGAMIESNLKGGKQSYTGDKASLAYGVSISDDCIDWETTEALVFNLFQKLGG